MFKLVAALACVASLGPVPAYAATYVFSARVDQANELVPVGTVITGSFSYDEGLLPSVVYPVEEGQTVGYQDASIMLNAVIRGISYSSLASAYLADDAGSDGDGFGLTALTPTYVLQFGYQDPTGAIFSSVALPNGQLPILATDPRPDPNDDDDLTVSSAYFSFVDLTRGAYFDGTVFSITPAAAAVPEVSTWAMLVAGFGFIGGSIRRRSQLAVRAG